LNADVAVVGTVLPEACDMEQLVRNDLELFIDEQLVLLSFNLPRLSIVELIDVATEVAYHGPAVLRKVNKVDQPLIRMHIGALTDVDGVLVLNQSTEDFEEVGDIA
jgi:hypothetical protein